MEDTPEVREEALLLRGVDDMATRDIKRYVDNHIKPGYTFATRDDFAHLGFQTEWVDDTRVNLIFETPEAATEALNHLVLEPAIEGNEELECKPCENGSVLYVRKSLDSDRKVKNASQYSRYYLLNGEPTRAARNKYRERDSIKAEGHTDLITGEISVEHEDDLFKDRISKPLSSRIEPVNIPRGPRRDGRKSDRNERRSDRNDRRSDRNDRRSDRGDRRGDRRNDRGDRRYDRGESRNYTGDERRNDRGDRRTDGRRRDLGDDRRSRRDDLPRGPRGSRDRSMSPMDVDDDLFK